MYIHLILDNGEDFSITIEPYSADPGIFKIDMILENEAYSGIISK